MEEILDICGTEFEKIYEDIKKRYLSNTNFPKMIIGTGLSISMGIPGMYSLGQKLDDEFSNLESCHLKEIWDSHKDKIKSDGLEAALLDVSTNEDIFIKRIKEITSEFILDEEYAQHSNIMSCVSGFEKLLEYLSRTVSVNNPLIDVMTPNYDRIIELTCDKLKLRTTLGFFGNTYQSFNSNILKSPYDFYAKRTPLVRVFKPHGSINWIKRDDGEYQCNDYQFLKDNKQRIDIVAPGRSKYEAGMINDIFRCHREIFNEIISDSKKDFSIFIYGYGFNDQHFNSVFEDTEKNVIVLTKEIKYQFIEKALKHDNWTLFYQDSNDENKNYMIYRQKKYILNEKLWDLSIFSKYFFYG